MDEQTVSQAWLALLTLFLGGFGVVLWHFAQKVMDMPKDYATKQDLKSATDGWKDEMRQMREERRQDAADTQRKLDKIDDAVAGIHQRIDAAFQRRSE